MTDHVDGDGEDDGAVVLRGDVVQSLQISQLQQKNLQVTFKYFSSLNPRPISPNLPSSFPKLVRQS